MYLNLCDFATSKLLIRRISSNATWMCACITAAVLPVRFSLLISLPIKPIYFYFSNENLQIENLSLESDSMYSLLPLILYTSTSAQRRVQKLHVAIGNTVCLMTCLDLRPRGSAKSAGASGVFDPLELRADAEDGGVGMRRCAAGRRDAQLAGCDEAPDTRRKRRLDVTLLK